MTSINYDLSETFFQLENDMMNANKITLENTKKITRIVVTEKYRKEYIKRQRRINKLKSPFIMIKNTLQEVIGENIEKIELEELIDLEPVIIEEEKALKIIESLSYTECLEYLKESNKIGLKKTNRKWTHKKEW